MAQVDVTSLALKVDATEVKEGATALDQLAKQGAKTSKEAEDFTRKLKEQADQIGKTKKEILQMQAAQMGLSTSQMASVQNSMKLIDAHERHEAVMGKVKFAAAAVAGAILAAGAMVYDFLKQAKAAFAEAEEMQIRLQAGLRATKNAVGLTLNEMNKLADSMMEETPFDDETIRRSMAAMLVYRSVQGDTFKEGMRLAADMAAAMGTDLPAAAMAIGKALENPGESLMALERQFGKFDASVKENIKTLSEENRIAEAQAEIFKLLEERVGGTAKAMQGGITGSSRELTKQLGELTETVGSYMAQILGAEQATQKWTNRVRELREALASITPEQMQNIKADTANFMKMNSPATFFVAEQLGFFKDIERAKEGAEEYRKVIASVAEEKTSVAAELGAAAAREQQAIENSSIAYKAMGEIMKETVPQQDRVKKAVDELSRRWNLLAGKDLEDAIKKYGSLEKAQKALVNTMNKDSIDKEAEKYKKVRQMIDEATGKSSQYTEAVTLLNEMHRKGKIDGMEYAFMMDHVKRTMTDSGKEAERLRKEMEKLNEDALKKFYDATSAETTALQKQAEELEQSVKLFGKGKEAVFDYAIAQKELEIAQLDGGEAQEWYRNQLEKQVDALRRAKVATIELAEAEKAAELKKKMDETLKAGFEETDKTAREVFVNFGKGFSSFEDMVRRATDTLKSTLLNALYEMTARPFVIELMGNLTGRSDIASQMLGGGGGGGGLGNILNMFTGGGNGAGGAGLWGTIGSGMASLGTSLFGAGSSMTGLGLGMSSAAGSGIFSSIGAGFANLMSGATSSSLALGQMIPGIGTIIAGIYMLHKMFGDKGENWKGQIGYGNNANAYTSDSVFGQQGFVRLQGQDEINRQIQSFMSGTSVIDNVLARGLSQEQIARISGNLQNNYTRRTDGQPAEFAFGKNDQTAAAQLTLEFLKSKYGTVFDEIDKTWADYIRTYKGKSEDLVKEIAEFATLVDKLASTGISGLNVAALRDVARDGEELGDTLTRVMEVFQATSLLADEAFGALGMATFEARQQIVDLAGGIEAFTKAQNTYYDQFYSEEEKRAKLEKQLKDAFAGLNMEMPTTREGFRALVEAQDLTTESGRTAYGILMQLVQAFAALVPATQEVVDVVAEVVEVKNPWVEYWQNFSQQVQDSVSAFIGNVGNLFAGEDMGTSLTGQLQLLEARFNSNKGYMDRNPSQYWDPWSGGYVADAQWLQAQGENNALAPIIAQMRKDLMLYTQLEALYGGKASDMFDLEKWFEEQKSLFAGNTDGLLAVEKLYLEKRAKILEEAATGGLDQVARQIENYRQQILEFRDSLVLSAASPLSGIERRDYAVDQYNRILGLAQGNDVNGLRDYRGAASDYLRELESFYGRASAEYQAAFARVRQDSLVLGTGPLEPPSSGDVLQVRDAIVDMNAQLSADMNKVAELIADLTRAVNTNSTQQNALLADIATAPVPLTNTRLT